jgi:hypothetical protein
MERFIPIDMLETKARLCHCQEIPRCARDDLGSYIFGKSNKENISEAERNELKRTVPLLVEKYRGEL